MDTLIKLTNPAFKIEFAGKEYEVKKATLSQVSRYMLKLREVKEDPEQSVKLVSYGLYIILHTADPEITEDFVYENLPNVDPIDLLTKLGFIVPRSIPPIVPKTETLTSESSSAQSQIEPDGLQVKSGI